MSGCTTLNASFGTPSAVAVSPDGAHVYSTTSANSIVIFARNPSTGLARLSGMRILSLSRKQRKFRVGQTVEVWVSAPNFNTKVARIALKKGKQPAHRSRSACCPAQTKVAEDLLVSRF